MIRIMSTIGIPIVSPLRMPVSIPLSTFVCRASLVELVLFSETWTEDDEDDCVSDREVLALFFFVLRFFLLPSIVTLDSGDIARLSVLLVSYSYLIRYRSVFSVDSTVIVESLLEEDPD